MVGQPEPNPADLVLLVDTGAAATPVREWMEGSAPKSLREVPGPQVAAFLRSHPFQVMAVVLSGDGESPLTTAALDAIKQVAPRMPIVFLDSRESRTSELRIRRAGVHYYAHAPANQAEIDAVLASIRTGSGARRRT